MQKLTIQEQKIINQKWSIKILIILHDQKRHSYRSIKNIGIPNSTLSLRVNELTKYRFVEKYIYGSRSKPYYSDYKITEFGLDYLNSILINFNL